MIFWPFGRSSRRKKLKQKPFSKSWLSYLESNFPYYQNLSEEQKNKLQDHIKIFIDEKDWYGLNGLEINDEIKVTIAAHACLLILELPHDYYSDVISIYVYPSTVVTPERPVGVFEIRTTPVRGPMAIAGEAHYKGPVIIVWDTLKKEVRHPERGHNVVFHEFAHKLDFLNGLANGTPPLKSKELYQQWGEVFSEEYNRLRKDLAHNKDSFFDSYAATNEAEFFAVVTEYYFTKPDKLKRHHAKLYDVLQGFYKPSEDES